MSTCPRISVTVLNYNYARFLPECLDSILSQTFADFEVIVIDDCSTDESLSVVQPYLADERVRLITHEDNRGYVASLIEGTEEHSSGDYVTVISADDLARRPDAFSRQVAMLDARPDMTFCFSAFDKMLPDGSAQTHASAAADEVLPSDVLFRRLACDNGLQVLHSGAMIRRSAYDAAGGYRRDVRYAPDLALWLRLALDGSAGYAADALYGYRIHASQMSGIGGHEKVMRETLAILDRACDEAQARGLDVRATRRQSAQAYLFGAAMDEVFRGLRNVALQRALVALRLRPRDALASRSFWIILMRALLGERGFGVVRSTGRLVTAPLR